MKNIIKENKLMIVGIIGYIVLIIFALNINAENNQKDKELADEKYQKNLIEALYGQRQEFINDKTKINEMIANLETSKLKKDEEIFRTESLIRCEKVNNNRLRGEAHDDCKLNWGNYSK